MKATKLLTLLLPLLVFMVVDSFVTDVRISIACAIAFAVGQLAVTWARSRAFDWFLALDAVLIAGLGGISIAFDDELFFKTKPAIIEGLTVVFMAAMICAPDRFLVGYFGRMSPDLDTRPQALRAMRSMLGWMCGLVVLHVGAVLYTALESSKPVWAFVSGPGFYLALAPVFLVALGRGLRARRIARRASPQQIAAPK